MNIAMIIGRLVAQPELVKTPKEKSLVRMTIAVKRRYKNGEGEREADFINTVFWGRLAENFAVYAKKGALVALEGEIRTRSYTDKFEQKRRIVELVVSNYDLLESRSVIAQRENQRPMDAEEMILDGEDLPF
ncbi:single-stranded DNA-binding protein [Lactococcus termiticola]|uniref:Single-stranded DNA-binding protein n=1 Tax=Lactococcus termiticola TaxID=2169526 RepID=A0A2R5HDY6_9LACT|nr:single-stranded DNA-binding protein [Lactococcus termiticola]GBG96036.1 single-stranded DNA-binding protein [Lactococcus termiticola]